ncbi:MAG: hypothetical protein ACYTFG_00670 [Planctomycetota bacterium]
MASEESKQPLSGAGILSLNLLILNLAGVAILGTLTLFSSVFLWPKFVDMCRDLEMALPWPTTFMLGIHPWVYLVLFPGLLLALVAKEIYLRPRKTALAANAAASVMGLAYLLLFVMANVIFLLPVIELAERAGA